ncbi:MAG: hypothetical protein ABI977_24160 [Acidobacteriota bacterium]
MNNILKVATLVLSVSLVAMLWGMNYTSTHQLSGVANMFGNADPTYNLAGNATIAGGAGFLLGIALLIGGLVRKKS